MVSSAPYRVQQSSAFGEQAVKQTLAALRAEVRTCAENLSVHDLQSRSVITRRSVGGILAHIVFSTRLLFLSVQQAKRGKAMPAVIATPFVHELSYRLSEWRSKKLPAAYLRAYDRAHDSLLTYTATLNEEDWYKSTVFPEPICCPVSVRAIFMTFAPMHTRAHLAEINQSLGVATGREDYHAIMQTLVNTLRTQREEIL